MTSKVSCYPEEIKERSNEPESKNRGDRSLAVASVAGGVFGGDLVFAGLVGLGLVVLPFGWPVAVGVLGTIAVVAAIVGIVALVRHCSQEEVDSQILEEVQVGIVDIMPHPNLDKGIKLIGIILSDPSKYLKSYNKEFSEVAEIRKSVLQRIQAGVPLERREICFFELYNKGFNPSVIELYCSLYRDAFLFIDKFEETSKRISDFHELYEKENGLFESVLEAGGRIKQKKSPLTEDEKKIKDFLYRFYESYLEMSEDRRLVISVICGREEFNKNIELFRREREGIVEKKEENWIASSILSYYRFFVATLASDLIEKISKEKVLTGEELSIVFEAYEILFIQKPQSADQNLIDDCKDKIFKYICSRQVGLEEDDARIVLLTAHALITRAENEEPITDEERLLVYRAYGIIRSGESEGVNPVAKEKINEYMQKVEPLREEHIIYRAHQILLDVKGKFKTVGSLTDEEKKIISDAEKYIVRECFKGLPVALEVQELIKEEIPTPDQLRALQFMVAYMQKARESGRAEELLITREGKLTDEGKFFVGVYKELRDISSNDLNNDQEGIMNFCRQIGIGIMDLYVENLFLPKRKNP